MNIWRVKLKYLDNPAGPLKGTAQMFQDNRPLKGSLVMATFGRAQIVTVRKITEPDPKFNTAFTAFPI